MRQFTGTLPERLAAVRTRIANACTSASRDPKDIAILAVTKAFGPDAIESALIAGLLEIGENYYQEAAEKFAMVVWPPGAQKHFIGRLQRNKLRRIAQLFDVVQTLDSLERAFALNLAAADTGRTLEVLLQVNVAEDQRQGLPPASINDCALQLAECRNLRLRGLMVMGPQDRAATAAAFQRGHLCFEELRKHSEKVTILSMGMSADVELAVAHGSTMLRLGSALFGERQRLR